MTGPSTTGDGRVALVSDVAQNGPSEASTRSGAEPKRSLLQRAMIGAIAIAVLVGLALFAGAVIPRWWSTQISNIVDERITVGTFLGIAVGAIFTLIPLFVLWLGWRLRKTARRWLIVVVVAMITAFPNLATLGIELGNSSGARSARVKLDTDAPGFQGGTLFGAMLGVVIGVAMFYLGFSRRRNKRLARELKAQMNDT